MNSRRPTESLGILNNEGVTPDALIPSPVEESSSSHEGEEVDTPTDIGLPEVADLDAISKPLRRSSRHVTPTFKAKDSTDKSVRKMFGNFFSSFLGYVCSYLESILVM